MDKKVAIITGGTSGIGLATAKTLVAQNYHVIVLARNSKNDLPEGIQFEKCDVTDSFQVKDVFNRISQSFPKIDALVNSAGNSLETESDLENITNEDIDTVIDLNLKGVIYCIQNCLSLLKKTKGTIVNISSQLGIKADSETPLYCASKAGLIMLTQSLALRYSQDKVRINCVCPGPTDTPLLQKYFSSHEEMEQYYQKIPLGRMATADEIADLISYLVSDKALIITGGIFSIDGGAYLKTY